MEYPKRKRLRLASYDYSQPGYYFITICTYVRQQILTSFVGADLCVRLSLENIPLHWLWELQGKFPGIKIDIYAVMPDHIHFILVIPGGHAGPPLQEMMKWYKTQTTNAYIRRVKGGGLPPFQKHLWQRGYCDHILRNDADLAETRQYILNNPLKWIQDKD